MNDAKEYRRFRASSLTVKHPSGAQHSDTGDKAFDSPVAHMTDENPKFTPKKELDGRALDILLAGTRDERTYLCSLDPKYFAIYYFSEYFTYKIPPFHYDFYEDCGRLLDPFDNIKEALWEAYRESAKTSIAKIAFITWAICYKKREYINVDSEDKANAEALLFDVTIALQTNKRIIADFGHLYYRKSKQADEEEEGSKMKRLGSFITENQIKVEAHSVYESTRGRLYKNRRPDCYLLDDFENLLTIKSQVIMSKIKDHIDEMRAGLAPGACVLYLGNMLLEDGVVSYIKDLLKKNPASSIVREIPVVSNEGVVSWSDKYVKTDAEAFKLNETIDDPKKRKISLETKRRELGEVVYQREMMNNPSSSAKYVFDREKVKRDMLKCYEPIKTYGQMKIWLDYEPDHKYGIGADTAEGKGGDANASGVIDFTRRPNAVVATYENNMIKPNVFGIELARQGNYYGEAMVCPELNNTGWATVAKLQDVYDNIYQGQNETRIQNQNLNEYGLRKTAGHRYTYISEFATAYHNGEVEIFDKALLTEMLHYTEEDLQRLKAEDGVTRHFDKLHGVAIAWFIKKSVLFSDVNGPGSVPGKRRQNVNNPYKSKQKPYQGLV